MDVNMKNEAIMMNVDSDGPRALVRRVDRMDHSSMTSLMMRQEECRFMDITIRVLCVTIVAVLAVYDMVVED